MDHESEWNAEIPEIEPGNLPAGPGESGDEPAPPPHPATPVSGGERLVSLDLLRGFAVLGILLINVWAYALPFPAAMNPRLIGHDQGLEAVVYAFVHMTAYSKMMPIFGMLFGAGLILFTRRVEERAGRSGHRWFARQWWLLVIGMVHGYLLWNGDILVPYAMCGLIVYRLRRSRRRTLVILAVLVTIVPAVGMQVGAHFMDKMRVGALETEMAVAAGDSLGAAEEASLEMWHEQKATWDPTQEDFDELVTVMRGGYVGIIAHGAPELMMMHLFMYPLGFGWNICGFMMIGMALFKTGVLQGERSDAFYLRMALVCYAVGLPAAWGGMRWMDIHHDSFIDMIRLGFPLVNVTGLVVALGHVALIVLAGRRGWFGPLAARLAATGRMAFTNYLTQTLICTTIFYGSGLGLFGALGRFELLGVVAVVWALQLWWSPLWLGRFRFGPMEWLWRSLSYGSRQPMRVRSRPTVG